MKKLLIVSFGFLGVFTSCKKDPDSVNKKEVPEEALLNIRPNMLAAENLTANNLTFDQSFIDFVFYSTNNLGAGEYINKKEGNLRGAFIGQIKQCTENRCITRVVGQYQLSIDTLDEYFYSAMASGLIFRVEHPEFDNMNDAQRTAIFQQAFISGMNSSDPRWLNIKSNLNSLLSYYYSIQQYKTGGDWNAYVGCFLNEIKGVFLGVLQLGTIVEAIKTGSIAKGLTALKSFLKTTVGRTLSWVGLAILAWDIFDCCWDVSHTGGGTSFMKNAGFNSQSNWLIDLIGILKV